MKKHDVMTQAYKSHFLQMLQIVQNIQKFTKFQGAAVQVRGVLPDAFADPSILCSGQALRLYSGQAFRLLATAVQFRRS